MLDHIHPIPKATVLAAKAVFSCKNFYLLVGEQLGSILNGIHLEYLSDAEGNVEKATLSLITFFQFVEGLTDEQALEAVRTRVDWKYALHLPPNSPTLQPSALCGFRQRVVFDAASQREFQKLVDQLVSFDPPVVVKYQSFKISAILVTVCSLNRLNWIVKGMCEALEALAAKHSGWLRRITLPHWYGRYNRSVSGLVSASALRQFEFSVVEIRADIQHLLEEVEQSDPGGISELPEIKNLQQIWQQQFKNPAEAVQEKWTSIIVHDCDVCIYRAGIKGVRIL